MPLRHMRTGRNILARRAGPKAAGGALGYGRQGLTATDVDPQTAGRGASSVDAVRSVFLPLGLSSMSDTTLQPPVTVTERDAVRIVTVNRPDKLNALNAATIDGLDAAFVAAINDPGVRAIVLTGAGPKAFVAGADIAEMNTLTPVQGRDFALRGQRMMRRIERSPKPVIAMVNGFALGGGLELAMSCHLRIAADSARMGQPEIGLGLIPGFGGTQRLLRLAGRAATLELCLLGAPVDAQRALALGIVNRVVPAAELEAQTMAIAQQLAAAAPLAARGIIDCINYGGECGIEEGLEYEATQFGLMFSTEDMREGTSAFLERRKPVFNGR